MPQREHELVPHLSGAAAGLPGDGAGHTKGWLYIGDQDVLHLTTGGGDVSDNRKAYLGQQSTATEGSGVVDHLGFRATGLSETMAHLKSRGVEFTQRMVDDQGLFQLFLLDPNGVKVELNFSNDEAVGVGPELMASGLDS